MDFKNFGGIDSSNNRKGGTFVKSQEYDNLKYRRQNKKKKDGTQLGEEGRFFIANGLFKDWSIDGDSTKNELKQFSPKDGSVGAVLAVVPEGKGTILKKSKRGAKTKNFKSTRLEAMLEKLGLINSTKVGDNQYLDVKLVAENVEIDGIMCSKVYEFSKGEPRKKEVVKETGDIAAPKVETAKVEAPASQTPVTPAPVAEAAKGTDQGW